jgi:lipid A 4'-phosphatase
MSETPITPDPERRLGVVLRREVREAAERPLLAATLVLAFVSLAFVALPQLDLSVSRLFYTPGHGFPDGSPIVEGVRHAGRWLEWSLAIGVCVPLALKLAFPAARLLVKPRETVFVLASLALGPGLIVNGVLKTFWGRARPSKLLQFGGDEVYSPVWWISDQCQRNCSFVSGEGAAAFWLLAIVFLVPREWKRPVAALTLPVVAAVSLARIAAGGHFVSDVLIAWLLVLLVMLLLQRLILQGFPPRFDSAVEAAFAHAGRAFRRTLSSWQS